MQSKVRFVVNPRSGPVRGGGLEQAIESLRLPGGLEGEVATTARRGHASELAAEAAKRGDPLVVAVGGDGTIHEVLQGLVGSDTALGIVPRGSGNALAREFALPLGWEAALEVIAEGRPRAVDVGEVAGRYFLSTFGVGLDARVVERYEREAGKTRGLVPYLFTGLREFFDSEPLRVRLRLGETEYELETLLLVVANARQYGGGAVVAPNARMDDGLLDIVHVPPINPVRAAYYTLKMFSGTLTRGSRLATRRAASLELELPPETAAQMDGESLSLGGCLTVRCLHRALQVWVPA